MHENQDLRRLLLLRVRTSRVETATRMQLRQHGALHDRRYQVRCVMLYMNVVVYLSPHFPISVHIFCGLKQRIKERKGKEGKRKYT